MYNYFNRDQIVHLFCCCCCQYLVREGGVTNTYTFMIPQRYMYQV